MCFTFRETGCRRNLIILGSSSMWEYIANVSSLAWIYSRDSEYKERKKEREREGEERGGERERKVR